MLTDLRRRLVPTGTRRIAILGGAESAIAEAAARVFRVSRHDPSYLRTGSGALRGADGVIVDCGAEDANLAQARSAAAAMTDGVIGVVVESWSGFAAALALDDALGHVRLRPLCAPAWTARMLLAHHPWSRLGYAGTPSTALICGTGALSEHLVIALLRSQHLAGQSPQIQVMGRGAPEWVAALKTRLPQTAQVGSVDAVSAANGAICAVYVTDAPAFDRRLPAAVPLYWSGPDAPSQAIAIAPPDARAIARSLFDDPQDRRARAIHEFYYEQSLRDGNLPGSRASMATWPDLPERFRQASRYQADHVPIKLGMVGCRETDGVGNWKFRFSDAEVEALARVEHERWSAVQMLDGWRYGEKRDDAQRLTPFLKPYDELTAEIQDRDRMPVRQIPAQLARIGHGVQRDVLVTLSTGDGEPGWRFAAVFARLLRNIARRYPSRRLMLVSALESDLAQRAVKTALDRRLAQLCLLLPDVNAPPAGATDFLARATRIIVTTKPVTGALHIHLGEDPPPAHRLVQMTLTGKLVSAPWL